MKNIITQGVVAEVGKTIGRIFAEIAEKIGRTVTVAFTKDISDENLDQELRNTGIFILGWTVAAFPLTMMFQSLAAGNAGGYILSVVFGLLMYRKIYPVVSRFITETKTDDEEETKRNRLRTILLTIGGAMPVIAIVSTVMKYNAMYLSIFELLVSLIAGYVMLIIIDILIPGQSETN